MSKCCKIRNYKIRHKKKDIEGLIQAKYDYWGDKIYTIYWKENRSWGECTDSSDHLSYFTNEWDIPIWTKIRLCWSATAIAVTLGIVLVVTGMSVPLFFTWDYHTGRDTGYISAIDKMTFSNDKTIYIRRRPLDATGYGYAESDESTLCTTADKQDVIEKAYEAMMNGKRVVLIYDTPKPFGWRAIGHCNSAPVTEIKYVEEEK